MVMTNIRPRLIDVENMLRRVDDAVRMNLRDMTHKEYARHLLSINSKRYRYLPTVSCRSAIIDHIENYREEPQS